MKEFNPKVAEVLKEHGFDHVAVDSLEFKQYYWNCLFGELIMNNQKGVLRLITVMLLFVCICGLMDVKTNQKWIIRTRRAMMKSISRILLVCPLNLVGHVEETQEEQVERLIGELQDENEDVRWNVTKALK